MTRAEAPPPGFTRIVLGRVVLLLRAERAAAARALGLLAPDAISRGLAAATGTPAGRGGTFVLTWPTDEAGAGERVLVRPLRHGGVLGPLLGRVQLGLGRARRELMVTAALRARGAPVPEPVFAWGRRLVGPCFEAALATRLEPGQDGVAFLASAPDEARLLAACAAAGSAVRRFHDAGGQHADLHLKNLLVEAPEGARDDDSGRLGTRVLVLDLDRACAGASPPARRRMAELMRLYRSLRKRGLLAQVGARGCTRFLDAYLDGDRALRTALLARLPAERRRLARHAVFYRRP